MRIVSGGQTGADRAALDAALELGVECGGWCPRGRRAEDGVLGMRYPLQETEEADLQVRTRRNVEDSDATLVCHTGVVQGGTLLTVEIARELEKPHRVEDLSEATLDPAAIERIAEGVAAWARENGVETLNVAGPRASRNPAVYRLTKALVESVLELLGAAD